MSRTKRRSTEEWLQLSEEDYGLPKMICKEAFAIQKEGMHTSNKHSMVKRADDEVLILDQSGINYIELAIWSIGFFPLLVILIHNWKDEIIIKNIIGIITLLILLYFLLRCFRELRREFIFNRITGKVTYPDTRWFSTKTVDFDDLYLRYHKEAFRSAIPAGLAIRRSKNSFVSISYDYPYTMLSLLVWYMDCNRPLPQGSAFDEYREKDYLRRKGEGFPEPLYPSAIETPEWKGAKKADRKSYAPDISNTIDPNNETNAPKDLG